MYGFHYFNVRFSSDVRGALHDFDFLGALQHAHLVKDRSRIDDCRRRLEWFAVALAHERELSNYFLIDFRNAMAERIVKNGRPVENFRQLLVKFTNRESIVGVVIFDGSFDARPIAVPNLLAQITWPDEQRELLFF